MTTGAVEIGSGAALVTAIDGRPGMHIVRVPVLDGGDVVFGYVVWVETAEGNATRRSNPAFVPSAGELAMDALVSCEVSAVTGRAGMSVVRVPLGSGGAYVAWVEWGEVTAAGVVARRSEPVVCAGG